MKRLLAIGLIVVAGLIGNKSQAATIAYVVDTDTTYATITGDRQWIDHLEDRMGYTVKVITDDSAHAITSVDSYDGYVLSETMVSANLTNLLSTTKGIVICDLGMYDDFRVAAGSRSATLLGGEWYLDRVDSTHDITKYMSNRIVFSYSGNSGAGAFRGLPQGARVLYNPSTKNWNGVTGDANDTSFCYAIEAGDSLTTGVAAGRRVVALNFYAMAVSGQTDAGYCHPYELFGNLCGWAFGDIENAYNVGYNCVSTERANPPEVIQAWREFGGTTLITDQGNEIYYNGRFGYDNTMGGGFLHFKQWYRKVMPGYEVDSVIWTYNIRSLLPNYNADPPPTEDPYTGFDFWLKLYPILRTEDWNLPLAYLNQGGNPYYIDTLATPDTVAWRGYDRANWTFIKTGPLVGDSVRWSTPGLAWGVDHGAAIDSVQINSTNFPADGSATIRLKIPGSVFDNAFNGFVWKTFDLTGGQDSTDIEIIPQTVSAPRTSRAQRFEFYLSEAIPLVLGVDDTTLTASAYVEAALDPIYNVVRNTGDGVLAIDSIRDNAAWLAVSPTVGNTPLTVTHYFSTTGLTAGVYTGTVTVYSATADNPTLQYTVELTLTDAPIEAPAPAAVARSGRKQ